MKSTNEKNKGEMYIFTYEINYQASIGTSSSRVPEKGHPIREFPYDGECKRARPNEISGVTERVTEVKNCVVVWLMRGRSSTSI